MDNLKKRIYMLLFLLLGIIMFIYTMYYYSKFGKVQFSPITYQMNTPHQLSFSDNTVIDISNMDFNICDSKETFSLNKYNIKSPYTNMIYSVVLPNELITNIELASNDASNIQKIKATGNLLTFTMKDIDFSIRIYNENPSELNKKEIADNIYSIQKYKNKVYKFINDDYIVITYDEIKNNDIENNFIQEYAVEILNKIQETEETETISSLKNINYYGYHLNIDKIDNIMSIGNTKLSFVKDNITYKYTVSKDLSPETSKKYIKQDNHFYYSDNTTTYKSYIFVVNDIFHTITLSSYTPFNVDCLEISNMLFTPI